LTVVAETSNGSVPVSAYSDIWNGTQSIESGLAPATFCVPPNTVETVGVFDSGHYMFSHWLDTGSALRFRTFSITTNTTLTAIYTNTNVPTPAADSIISVGTINSSGVPIAGIYTTLWLNGVLNQSCFSSCSFTVSNGHAYQVAVADFGSYIFNHWTNGSADRFQTVVVGNTTSTISEVSVYGVATGTPQLPRLSQEMAIQYLPTAFRSTPSGLALTAAGFLAVVAVLASFISFCSTLRRSKVRTTPAR
jgi:hypothetical protein